MELVTDVRDRLSDELVAEVRELASAVESRDGAPPLSDDALLHLTVGEAPLSTATRHVLLRSGAALTGYGQLRDGSAELAALSAADVLITAVEAAGRVDRVWSHGRRSPIGPALDATGYRRARQLWQLRRPLSDLHTVPMPAGVTLRGFRPGVDEDAWLAVNAAAFAGHPEQGSWTRADLEARMGEDWFDPDGFLLAVAEATPDGTSQLLGFHWTKVHPEVASAATSGRLGEVYVIGVAPAAQGRSLGTALLWAGLRHLAEVGCSDVLLYVDGDNEAAMRLYEKVGFSRYDLDVQYVRPAAGR